MTVQNFSIYKKLDLATMLYSNKHAHKFLFAFICLLVAQSGVAQLVKMPLPKYDENTQAGLTQTLRTMADDTVYVTLPFYEDFACFQTGMPDSTKWEDGSGVFINNNYPLGALSVGVATFDGQDETGTPYNQDAVSLIGVADRLVSHHFDFSAGSGVEIGDSLIISFYWQAKGLGELPNTEDFLELQFLNSDGSWVRQWAVTGGMATDFQKVEVRVNDSQFFHKDFQFRFINSGRLSGAYDVWNLDYIYFNFKNNINTDITQDMAIGDVPSSIFETYTSIPVSHLSSFPDSLIKDTVELFMNSIVNIANGREGFQDVYFNDQFIQTDEINGNVPLFFGEEKRLLTALTYKNLLRQEVNSLSDPDSVVWTQRYRLIQLEDNDAVPETEKNDTVDFRTTLHNYYAYDDGSAEIGVGVNKRFGQIAYRFYNYEPDTLRYIDLHLTQFGGQAFGSFRIKVWELLAPPGTNIEDSLRYESRSALPITYPNSIDELVRYDLGEYVAIDTGYFYIGIEQITDQSLMIGFDKSTDSGSEIFFNLGSEWTQNTTEQGSLMLRPVFENPQIVTSEPEELARLRQVNVFPNPNNGIIRWDGEVEQLALYDMTGRLLAQKKVTRNGESIWEIPQGISAGLYILQLQNKGATVGKKLILTR